MKELKEYIKQNRDAFDDLEPAAGHSARFEELLNRQEALKAKSGGHLKARYMKMAYIAAAVIVMAILAVTFYSPNKIIYQATAEEEKNIHDEFEATNEFYNQQMAEQIADLMCKLSYTDPDNQAKLSNDLKKLEDSNRQFVNDMAKTENKELAIRYLIKHYKTNIQALENINEKLGKHTKC